MSVFEFILLIAVFLVTSFFGVITGSNSLITVPVMFQFGIDPKIAVATNMFGLVFMAAGSSIPFVRNGTIRVRKIAPLLVLTAVGSALGAALVAFITDDSMKAIVSVSMIAMAVFILLRPNAGVAASEVSRVAAAAAFVLTFLLGIYGGLYSGGYVTMLTAVLVAFFGMRFAESVAATKLINTISSGIATIIFMFEGLVDYRLGIALAVTMFIGGYAGAHFATKLDDVWLRRIFLATVLALAAKTLYDLFL